jgi:hypothetical protein
MSKKKKKKPDWYILPRNWHAVNAQMRNSAGSMGDEKKKQDKSKCRKKVDPKKEGY